jgi:hypothetical protein
MRRSGKNYTREEKQRDRALKAIFGWVIYGISRSLKGSCGARKKGRGVDIIATAPESTPL